MPHDDEPLEPVEPLQPVSDPVDTARKRHGSAGAILAAGMFGVDIALGRKPKEEAPVVVSSNSEPIDIDTDGITIPVAHDVHVVAPPLPPSMPITPPAKRKRR